MLWHWLTCLDPPLRVFGTDTDKHCKFLLGQLALGPTGGAVSAQRQMGRQGPVHLASRSAAFRLQFIQHFITLLTDLMWRDVASCIFRQVGNLGLDDLLFLTDLNFQKLNRLPSLSVKMF